MLLFSNKYRSHLSTRKRSRKGENRFNTIYRSFAISVESGEKSRFVRGRTLAGTEFGIVSASRAPRREIVYIIHADMWMYPPAAAADGRALF